MGSARGDFTCLISSTSSQKPENTYSSVPAYQQYLRQKTSYCEKAHPHNPSHYDFVNMPTWLQVISMGQCGDAAIGTTSVPLRKPLRTAHYQRHGALHHCGDLDQFPTNGRKCLCTVRFPSHANSRPASNRSKLPS